MCCVELTEAVRAFRPWNEQEARDREELLRRLESGEALPDADELLRIACFFGTTTDALLKGESHGTV